MTKLEDTVTLRRAQLQLLDWATNALMYREKPVVLEIGIEDDVTADHLRSRLSGAHLQSVPATSEAIQSLDARKSVALIHAAMTSNEDSEREILRVLLKAHAADLCGDDAIIVARCEIVDGAFQPDDIADFDRSSGYRTYRVNAPSKG